MALGLFGGHIVTLVNVKRLTILVYAFVTTMLPAQASEISVGNLSLTFSSTDVAMTKSIGGNDRGPALAVLKDGVVLLGGGIRGGSIYIWSEDSTKPKKVGQLISPQERIQDSRFAITDIAVLSENKRNAELLVSFPRLTSSRCVEVAVFRATLDKSRQKIVKRELWFRSKPCAPISAVQHAAGRLAVIDDQSAYLTVGDLGFRKIMDRSQRGDLGSVFKISKEKVVKISMGHRNQQGIVLLRDGNLLVSEHGPRGGDEINIVNMGVDYGWPFVTYGAPYGQGDYVIPDKTGVHDGYREPIKYWVPSIAPTELIQLPKNGFGNYSSGLVMGTLREESLVFMQYSNGKISETEIVNVGARIRDLEILDGKRFIASTDDGRLLIFSAPA